MRDQGRYTPLQGKMLKEPLSERVGKPRPEEGPIEEPAHPRPEEGPREEP